MEIVWESRRYVLVVWVLFNKTSLDHKEQSCQVYNAPYPVNDFGANSCPRTFCEDNFSCPMTLRPYHALCLIRILSLSFLLSFLLRTVYITTETLRSCSDLAGSLLILIYTICLIIECSARNNLK